MAALYMARLRPWRRPAAEARRLARWALLWRMHLTHAGVLSGRGPGASKFRGARLQVRR